MIGIRDDVTRDITDGMEPPAPDPSEVDWTDRGDAANAAGCLADGLADSFVDAIMTVASERLDGSPQAMALAAAAWDMASARAAGALAAIGLSRLKTIPAWAPDVFGYDDARAMAADMPEIGELRTAAMRATPAGGPETVALDGVDVTVTAGDDGRPAFTLTRPDPECGAAVGDPGDAFGGDDL